LYDQIVDLCKRLEYEREMRESLDQQIAHLNDVLRVIAPVPMPTDSPIAVIPEDIELTSEIRAMQREILKAGWVETEGKFIKSWRRRWFVLRDASVVYFESLEKMVQSGGKIRGEMRLDKDDVKVWPDVRNSFHEIFKKNILNSITSIFSNRIF
jgi:hypothetical protein